MSAQRNCPFCGMDNQCGHAAGAPHGSCWCDNEFFPEEIFDQLPSDALAKTCICQNCLTAFKDRIATDASS